MNEQPVDTKPSIERTQTTYPTFYAAGDFGENYKGIPVDPQRGLTQAAINGFRYWAYNDLGIGDADPNETFSDPTTHENIPLGALYSRKTSHGGVATSNTVAAPEMPSTAPLTGVESTPASETLTSTRVVDFDTFCGLVGTSLADGESFDSAAYHLLVRLAENPKYQVVVQIPDKPEERDRKWAQDFMTYVKERKGSRSRCQLDFVAAA